VKTLSYKTQSAKKHEIDRKWHIIDAEGQIVGRMCTTIASMLRGKHKPQYTPHVDTGDYIIVINADKVRFTGTPVILVVKRRELQEKQWTKNHFSL
jgi:large subunit ribosomal protein L13